jgi:hypothetical protein
MEPAAIGLRVHSGWVAAVVVTLHDGVPVVLLRKRPHLVETFTYTFRQPYHTAQPMPLAEARAFVSQVRGTARTLAYQTIRAMRADLKKLGYNLNASALLLASGRELPALDKILASHALIHTADGELFREALLHAAKRATLGVHALKERGLLESAAGTIGLKTTQLMKRVAELGKPLGAPWSQDEKLATVAAWLALCSRRNL